MNLSHSWLSLQMRPRVVHRLPGRLRIHIPALRHVDSGSRDVLTTLLERFQLPDAIESVRVNTLSGNIVILYRAEKISERRVLNWVFDVKTLVEEVFIKLLQQRDGGMERSRKKLYHYIINAAHNGAVIDRTFKIPDDIWNQE